MEYVTNLQVKNDLKKLKQKELDEIVSKQQHTMRSAAITSSRENDEVKKKKKIKKL